ncbi:acyl-CoA dehydrogenase [Gryllotalpicola reticulitermitis]|uniref:Acyl-CoA dehydrogenase n=1 Tax=Gryllotalpicola reticulitermitis TaxID=1184153 RepID=A0ABV8Q3P1_9MICO
MSAGVLESGEGLSRDAQQALARLSAVRGAVRPALEWATDVGRWAPAPGTGSSLQLWEFFVEAAAIDVAAARVMEPHLDALAILSQLPAPLDLGAIGADADSTWGVFAAEGKGFALDATEDAAENWWLNGTKPWCSLAGELTHALVTASVPGGDRRLFAVALRDPGVTAEAGPWAPRGLTQVVSAPVRFEGVRAVPVGGAGWYLARPGFFWGGIGVAACWLGGAIGVARALIRAARTREPDQLGLAHLGAVDGALSSARAALTTAAELIDRRGQGTEPDWAVLMLRTRNTVASAVELVLERVGHALGPAPLALDADHAARVADLQLYVRQHHAERDEAALGRAILESGAQPW